MLVRRLRPRLSRWPVRRLSGGTDLLRRQRTDGLAAGAALSDGTDLLRRLARLEARVGDLERIAPAEFSIMHWNVLADQYASNLLPWFSQRPLLINKDQVSLRRESCRDGH